MSGGSQHNPNGRQSQLGPGWSPLQLQVANFLARAPQVHMPSDRGVTWHTPTPPPHLYHVPAPSPPDPLQAMKSAGSNSVYRHTGTPPELYRHTPTPPDKHLMRHTPSPGDVKGGASMPQAELYPHLGPGREKLRPEELLAYARVGVDLSISGSRAANGSPASPALSVRDAPTINSLIAASARQPPMRHHHARVDALLERLVPSPASPAGVAAHSVIVHPRAAPTPSPPSSNEDSADSCGAPPGSKRKRKPERTLRVPSAPPPLLHPLALAAAPEPAPDPPRVTPAILHPPAPDPPPAVASAPAPPPVSASAPASAPAPAPASPPPVQPPPDPPAQPPSPPKPVENGDTPHMKSNGPEKCPSPPPPQPPPARRKTRSGSAETIADIAAMIASTDRPDEPIVPPPPADCPVTVDNLKSVLASPEPKKEERSSRQSPVPEAPAEAAETPAAAEDTSGSAEPAPAAAAPRRRSARAEQSANVPVDSPSEAKPAEPETSEAPTAEPTAASFVEVENQLEKMFAGIEEQPPTDAAPAADATQTAKAKKRRKSAPTKGERKAARVSSRASTDESGFRRKAARKKDAARKHARDAYDSGSNASSGRSRGPYIQIRGPRESPLSVSVVNARSEAGEDEGEAALPRRRREQFRNGLRARGLHASTLGLRYDASTPDATWLCVFCERGPHAAGLGDLFGPYALDTDCDEYRALDEATRRRYSPAGGDSEVWFHSLCGVWAPGVVAAGARVWGLAPAVWAARPARCAACARPAAAVACAARACRARAHLPCARAAMWKLCEDTFRALCPAHAALEADKPSAAD